MRLRAFLIVSGAVLAAAGPLCLSAPFCLSANARQPDVPSSISAVADASRPPADRARDSERKPAEMLTFAGVMRGMRVLELDPGKGYFTRLLSAAVGPKGEVFVYVPEESVTAPFKPLEAIDAVAAEPGRGNVHVLHYPLMQAPGADLAGRFDLVWTSLNYHDFHNVPGFDALAFNRHIFEALKPGGTYMVIDHAALPGAGAETTHKLHRIDEALVRREVLAAGFVLDGVSGALANPADPRDIPVFDPAIRGHTDQFVLRFRKPG